jgi:hypothetical protein
MATKIITKNSSTTTAIPTAGDLVQGELAVNVTDKRLFTEDSGGAIVELGTNPSTLTVTGAITGTATFSGNVVIANGSYAAPAIAFASDTDTGITRSGTNSISIVAGGAHKFYSDANTSLATISAGTSNLTLGVNAGNSIIAGGNYNTVVGDEAGDCDYYG